MGIAFNSVDLFEGNQSSFFEEYVPEEDATAVRRLKEAGAVVLAKTNFPDFATSWFAYSSAGGG